MITEGEEKEGREKKGGNKRRGEEKRRKEGRSREEKGGREKGDREWYETGTARWKNRSLLVSINRVWVLCKISGFV